MTRVNSELISFMGAKKKVKILIYVLLSILLYGTSNASIYYANLTPFSISIVFALLWIGFNGYYLSIIFSISYMLANLNLNSLIVVANVVVVLVILEIVKSKMNEFNLKKWQIFLICLSSEIMYIIMSLGDGKENLALFVSIVLGMFFLYACLCFLEASLCRGMLIKLNLDEKICGALILIVFMAGMTVSNISIINLGMLFGVLIILVSVYTASAGAVVIISSIVGIGSALINLDISYISLFVIIALAGLSFKCHFRFLSPIAAILSYVIFSLLFSTGITLGEVFSLIIGGLVFIFIPKKLLSSFGSIFIKKSEVLYKNILEKSKSRIVKRLDELGRVFEDMNDVYRKMVKGILPEEKAKEMLKGELKTRVCANCSNYNSCYRSSGSFLENSLEIIVSTAYDKGKVLLIDTPQYLTTNCQRVNLLLAELNAMISSYMEYSLATSNLDTSRVLVADQLDGVSKLLGNLSKEMGEAINFNKGLESRIKEELSYKNIICLDAMVYETLNNVSVEIIVKNTKYNDCIIENIVSKSIKRKMQVQGVAPTEIPGANLITLGICPNYDIVFGSSSINKHGEQISGDNHSIIKISHGKYMLSICDGMGSGARAKQMSDLTLRLIENFYKAQFDNENIINSVNKLLSLTEEENFSTIDLCVIDCFKNTYDFIKLGAVNGYIKRSKGGVEQIESSGLPVGMLEELRPHITQKLISSMDMVILISDGVFDAFGGLDIGMYISGIDSINPQTLSEIILAKALELNDNIPKDDMTVVCARVIDFA